MDRKHFFDTSGDRPFMSKAQSFEESMSRLEEVVATLEGGELPLDTALARYEEGVQLVRHCRADLEQAELRVRKLVEEVGQTRVEDLNASTLFGGAR
jgi:exodeoxyribonuclease VII small subunit